MARSINAALEIRVEQGLYFSPTIWLFARPDRGEIFADVSIYIGDI
jgi:hypothetical protein